MPPLDQRISMLLLHEDLSSLNLPSLSPVMRSTASAGLIWIFLHHFVGNEVQETEAKILIICHCYCEE